MVKQRKKHNRKSRNSKGFNKDHADARKINASTGYETCTEQLSPFGGLLALIKFLDLIGFNRIRHFVYICPDAMLCGFFRVTRLPAASTFWRYVDSLGINQGKSLLKVMDILRERVWQLCKIQV